MDKQDQIKVIVLSLLENVPRCRDDDNYLFIMVVEYKQLSWLWLYDVLCACCYDTVRRSRQEIQRWHPELRGIKYKERKLKWEIMKKKFSLGYLDKLKLRYNKF